MGTHYVCFLLLASFVLSTSATTASTVMKSAPARAPEAYATLVYGEEFVLAARVLGLSLRETGTTRDLVALTTGSLPASSELTLASDGWRVVRVDPVENPARGPQPIGYPPRFAYVYTKLYIFKMTEYKKIVFLDGDILALRNMDVLFRCPGFCATLRHSERFNTGVMSLVPSIEMYDDMMEKVATMPSYTGGDQGFLNSYFEGFAHAPLFDENTPYTPDQFKYMRLPTTFNADIGLYVVNSNRWMIPRASLYVIHFTLGPFKPWVWWSGWLVRENPAWQAFRDRLPPDVHGLTGGRSTRQVFAERWMVALPWVALAAAAYYCWPSVAPAVAGLTGRMGAKVRRAPAAAVAALFRILTPFMKGSGSGSCSSSGSCSRGSGNGLGGGGAGGLNGVEVILRTAGLGAAAAAAAANAVSASGGAASGVGGGGGGLGGNGSGGALGMCGGGGAVAGGNGGCGAAFGGDVFPRHFMVASLLAGYGCVLAATVVTILIVPPEVDALYGWILSYEWGFLLLGLSYGAYLRFCYRAGRRAGHHPAVQLPKAYASAASPPLPLAETATSAAFLLASLLLAPWLGRLLGISSFAGTIVGTVFIGLGAVVVATVQFMFLPAQWFIAGRLAASGAGSRVA